MGGCSCTYLRIGCDEVRVSCHDATAKRNIYSSVEKKIRGPPFSYIAALLRGIWQRISPRSRLGLTLGRLARLGRRDVDNSGVKLFRDTFPGVGSLLRLPLGSDTVMVVRLWSVPHYPRWLAR